MPGLKKRAAGGRKANVIRVLVAEDHTVVRDGLVAIIKQEADMDVVAETGDGQQAAELWKKHRPDITLMDLRMPGLDGVNAIYQIRAADPNARIIVLTTYDGDEDIYRGMRAGAKSYLLKDVRREELFQCIREVHAGRTFLPPAVAGKVSNQMAGHDCLPVLPFARERLACVFMLCRGIRLPLFDGGLAFVGVSLVLHDCIFSETL